GALPGLPRRLVLRRVVSTAAATGPRGRPIRSVPAELRIKDLISGYSTEPGALAVCRGVASQDPGVSQRDPPDRADRASSPLECVLLLRGGRISQFRNADPDPRPASR